MSERSDKLKQNLLDLEVFMSTEVYVKWKAAREIEAQIFNADVAQSAASWDEVVGLRAARDNTLLLQSSFEELRDNLRTELNAVVEEDTQIASTRIV